MSLNYSIITAEILNLSQVKRARLREMTLESSDSYMRDTLDDRAVLCRVKVAIAQIDDNLELGWSMLRPYYGKDLIQVFVKPEFRRQNIGSKLFQVLNNNNVTAFAWDQVSLDFFNSLNVDFMCIE